MGDLCSQWQESVRAVRARGGALTIRGHGSKAFFGRQTAVEEHELLDTRQHSGIVDYDPGDLVVTVRAGTPLTQLDEVLAQQRQRLGFEPPHFAGGGTIGGAVAAGLSGPARPFAGAARDFVLGAEFINGRGELIQSGGRVIKNVAGYDLARLMAGALGTLGVMTQLSLRVVTVVEKEHYLCCNKPLAEVPDWMAKLARQPLPLSGLAWFDGAARIRLAGTAVGVEAAAARLGLPTDEAGTDFWSGLRNQTLPFFVAGDTPLWRLSHRPAAPVAELEGTWLIDWGGAQRWLRSREPAARVRAAEDRCG